MMDINRYIFTLASEKIGNSVKIDREALYKGICCYNSDHHLDEIIGNNHSEKFLKIYLEPILEMQPQALYDYFLTYNSLEKIKAVSADIFALAVQKYQNKTIQLSTLERLEAQLYKATDEFINMGKRSLIEQELSECSLDIEFIKGNSKNTSIRLMRKFRI